MDFEAPTVSDTEARRPVGSTMGCCNDVGTSNTLFSSAETSVNGILLEAFKPNILTIAKNQKNVDLKFLLSSRRRNQAPEKFYLLPRTVDGVNVKVIPTSVILCGCGDCVVVKVVITSICTRVKCGQPYSVFLTASNKFTRLTDLYGILIEEKDDVNSGAKNPEDLAFT